MTIGKELAALEQMTVGELQARHVELFGEQPRSRHREYLVRRIAWRLQALQEGGLSERARLRAADLADVADARVTPPRDESIGRAAPRAVNIAVPSPVARDPRLPPIGSAITRPYKGRDVVVTIRADGFEFEGELHGSLSAVAKVITGSHMNGFRFFGLEAKA